MGRPIITVKRVKLPSRGHLAFLAIRDYCKRKGYPTPIAEFKFYPTRKWRLDVAWTTEKIAIEIQGGIYTKGRHVRGKGFEGDCIKFSHAAADGWRILPVTYPMINSALVWNLLDQIFG